MQLLVVALCFVFVSLGSCQKSCSFNGPQDRATLQGSNFIENLGTGECLNLENNAVNFRVPISLQSCQWNTQNPSKSQLFSVKNSGGGSTLAPLHPNADGFCFTDYDGTLTTHQCSPKSDEQNWLIRGNLIPGGGPAKEYQIIQNSSGRCLKVNSGFGANNVVLVNCNQQDQLQLWRICTHNSVGSGLGSGFSG